MAEPDDMDPNAPLTRGEFKQALTKLATKEELKVELERAITASEERLTARLAAAITGSEGRMLAQLAARDQRLLAEMTAREQRLLVEMTALNAASERRLLDALGQHTAANQEDLSRQVAVVDDKYKDLPERVTRLEAAVFKPRRRSRS